MRIYLLITICVALVACTTAPRHSQEKSTRSQGKKSNAQSNSISAKSPYTVTTSKTVPSFTKTIIPLPEWEDDIDCDIDDIRSFDYTTLSACIQHSLDQKDYLKAERYIKLTPTIEQENILLKQRVAIARGLSADSSTQKSATAAEADLKSLKVHYLSLSEQIELQNELLQADPSTLIQKWTELLQKLKRKLFMKARYPEMIEMVKAMQMQAPTQAIEQAIDSVLYKALTRDQQIVQQELSVIKDLVEVKANFPAAKERLHTLETEYPHIEQNNQYSTLRSYIETKEQEHTSHSQQANVDSLKSEADRLTSIGEYLKAKELYAALVPTKHREHAQKSLINVAHNYCTEKRVLASNDLKQSLKHTGTDTEKRLLESALEHLNKCLLEFPQNDLYDTVEKNRALLLERLKK